MRLHELERSREYVFTRTGDVNTVGSMRAVVLDDGVERGIRAIEFRTGGGLRFEVLVDRAMDIGVAEFDDYSFGWRSATGFRHPGLHEINDEDGLSWLRSLSGLVVTCGLDHTLFGGQYDASNYRYPPKDTIRHGLRRPGGQHPGPPCGLRAGLGRRSGCAMGRRRGAPGCRLWRTPGAPAASRG